MTGKARKRTPSPKTVTFDPSPPTTLERKPRIFKFNNHREWEQYLDALLADLQNTISPGSGGGLSGSGYGSLNASRSARQSPGAESPVSKVEGYSVKSETPTYGKTQAPSGRKSPSQGRVTPTYGTKSPSFGSSTPTYGNTGYGVQSASQPSQTYTPRAGSAGDKKPYNNNLSELDNLLEDLSSSKYANVGQTENGMNGSYNGGSGARSPAVYSRPSSAQSTLNRPSVDSLLDELNTTYGDVGDVIYTGPKKVTITVKETKTETGFPGETELISSHVTTTHAPAASSATRELDDLMADLSNIKKCVTALEKTWHMDHFFCAQCGKQFGEDGFHEREGKPYCRDDYFDMFAPKCGACNRAIMENYISALNSQWHPDCFVCRDCRQPFIGGSFFDHEGQPYCETHYHLKRGSLCAGCHKPISGRCVTAMFRKFHPEHFVCAFCLKQLNKGTFKEQNDKPYCHMCFDKLFG